MKTTKIYLSLEGDHGWNGTTWSLMPWFLTKHLQDKFDSNLLFQITDDEKFVRKQINGRDQQECVWNILDIMQ